MKPSVGRIVHLASGAKCMAAIVTEVDPQAPPAGPDAGFYLDRVALTVFPGATGMSPVGHDEGKHPGTWHWPERAG
jgi:hypothetical protein